MALDADGRPDFGRLQRRMGVQRPGAARLRDIPVTLILFDVLYLTGSSRLDLPYTAHRRLLEQLQFDTDRIRIPPYWPGQVQQALEWTREHRLEGIIAKRLDSRYLAGRRSKAWIKLKNLQVAAVRIVGWVPSGAHASTVRCLLLAVPEAEGWRFVGTVGGFSMHEKSYVSGGSARAASFTSSKPTTARPPGTSDTDYALCAGVEGTIRQAAAVTDMHHARYRGLAKTHLEHVFSAVALNLLRLDAWWNGHALDRTRTSHLARLELSLAA